MADRYRYRSGNRLIKKYGVDTATVIEVGDLVYLASDEVLPASDLTWDTNLATTQATFANSFLGVAVEASADGEDDAIGVDISPDAVYEMDCASTTAFAGDPVGPAKQTGNALENQKMAEAVAASAVGRIHKSITSATKMLVTFASAFHTGSSNVNANIG